MTAYVWDKDTANSRRSACTGPCATLWPAITTSATPTINGITGMVATITGVNGGKQITINGLPIYAFSKDTKAGDTNGQVCPQHLASFCPRPVRKITTPNPVSSHQPDASQTPGGIRTLNRAGQISVKSPAKVQRAHKLHPVRRTTINLPSQPSGQRRKDYIRLYFDGVEPFTSYLRCLGERALIPPPDKPITKEDQSCPSVTKGAVLAVSAAVLAAVALTPATSFAAGPGRYRVPAPSSLLGRIRVWIRNHRNVRTGCVARSTDRAR
jgi:hypothetical protein